SFTPPPPPGNKKASPRRSEIVQFFAGFGVVDHGSDRCHNVDRLAFVPRPVTTLAVTSALGSMLRIEPEVQECVLLRTGDQVPVAATAAVAAARSSAWDKLLPSKG